MKTQRTLAHLGHRTMETLLVRWPEHSYAVAESLVGVSVKARYFSAAHDGDRFAITSSGVVLGARPQAALRIHHRRQGWLGVVHQHPPDVDLAVFRDKFHLIYTCARVVPE